MHQDNRYRELVTIIENGFPEDKILTPKDLHDFWPLRRELYTSDNVVFVATHP